MDVTLPEAIPIRAGHHAEGDGPVAHEDFEGLQPGDLIVGQIETQRLDGRGAPPPTLMFHVKHPAGSELSAGV